MIWHRSWRGQKQPPYFVSVYQRAYCSLRVHHITLIYIGNIWFWYVIVCAGRHHQIITYSYNSNER